jgi:hypothetical protein
MIAFRRVRHLACLSFFDLHAGALRKVQGPGDATSFGLDTRQSGEFLGGGGLGCGDASRSSGIAGRNQRPNDKPRAGEDGYSRMKVHRETFSLLST